MSQIYIIYTFAEEWQADPWRIFPDHQWLVSLQLLMAFQEEEVIFNPLVRSRRLCSVGSPFATSRFYTRQSEFWRMPFGIGVAIRCYQSTAPNDEDKRGHETQTEYTRSAYGRACVIGIVRGNLAQQRHNGYNQCGLFAKTDNQLPTNVLHTKTSRARVEFLANSSAPECLRPRLMAP